MTQTVQTPAPVRYAAFISYRHLSPDMEIAQALHKMLEHNRVRPDRRFHRNIRPVFLDTGELPTLENLDDGIYQALDNSECLIVICSPNLPLSKYCLREISYFKKIHGGSTNRIYTVLAAGGAQESFPEELRSEIRLVRDANGLEHEEKVEVEPLFANVAAPTLRKSLKKLRKTEFLRLAAAYYRCSYDKLYKRHRRWIIRNAAMAVCAAALIIGGFFGYAVYRNHAYNRAKADTFAAYAEERSQSGDELLSVALCREGWEAAMASGSQRLETALRSAAVQHHYKRSAMPAGQVTCVDYFKGASPGFYLNSDGTRMILQSQYQFQIVDVNSGEIYRQFPGDSAFVLGKAADRYITVEAIKDENGVFQDTVSVWEVKNSRLVNRIPFRPSTQASPQYKAVSWLNSPVTFLQDHDEIVLYLDEEGNPLSEEEARQTQPKDPAAQEAPFQAAQGSLRRGVKASVKNSAGETMLELEDANPLMVFSPDWRYFGAAQGDDLTVYETAGFTVSGQIRVDGTALRYLYLLRGAPYALCVYATEDNLKTELLDWRTGSKLMEATGYANVSNVDNSIYFMDNGTATRYQYRAMDAESPLSVIAQHGAVCLAARANELRLINGETGETLLSQTGVILNAQYSRHLDRLLIQTPEGCCCYDGTGALLWRREDAAGPIALSEDGQIAAWMNEKGEIAAANAENGSSLYILPASALAQLDGVNELAVSGDGLCALGLNGALWFRTGESQGQLLEGWAHARLYEDGVLALETPYAYVIDFEMRSAKTGQILCQPADNTGPWAYSPASGYLARQRETSGNHETPQLEVLRLENGAFTVKSQIQLPEVNVKNLAMDSTGNYLTVTVDNTTMVYCLPKMEKILSVQDCGLRYEEGRFWDTLAWDGSVFSAPCLEKEALYQSAMREITGAEGVRELNPEEKAHYSFD